ncbi:hypothetical protein BDD12DRAFT_260892 [Trichophaea hybrida]|nr:hypothetical protein BDD12DRAFT_260892 [Trichophaea hybrida]
MNHHSGTVFFSFLLSHQCGVGVKYRCFCTALELNRAWLERYIDLQFIADIFSGKYATLKYLYAKFPSNLSCFQLPMTPCRVRSSRRGVGIVS